jgi:hypothetical protein
MPAARVVSVNLGPQADLLIGGRPGRSGIDKRPYHGDREIMARLLEVEGRGSKWDQVAASVLSRA